MEVLEIILNFLGEAWPALGTVLLKIESVCALIVMLLEMVRHARSKEGLKGKQLGMILSKSLEGPYYLLNEGIKLFKKHSHKLLKSPE